jgi:acetate kinase
MNILVINAGSSSLKYQLMDPETGVVTAKGLCERIGLDGRLTHKVPAKDKKVEREISMPTHAEAIAAVLEILVDSENGVIASTDEIDAVGHRVLHGGDQFIDSCIIDEACKQAIRDCIPLGPLHNPANLMGIEACEKVMPGKPQVAVFDTAFHMTMPPKAYRYAIPTKYYEEDHLPQVCHPPGHCPHGPGGHQADQLPPGQRLLPVRGEGWQVPGHLYGPVPSGWRAHGHSLRRH